METGFWKEPVDGQRRVHRINGERKKGETSVFGDTGLARDWGDVECRGRRFDISIIDINMTFFSKLFSYSSLATFSVGKDVGDVRQFLTPQKERFGIREKVEKSLRLF